MEAGAAVWFGALVLLELLDRLVDEVGHALALGPLLGGQVGYPWITSETAELRSGLGPCATNVSYVNTIR
jgi:hypothetical protein